MELFGRSPALAHDGEPQIHLAWLAGLLEAEGTFIQPIPSEPRWPIVACQMTDRDVVEKVGSMFGTAVMTIPRSGRRTMYTTRLKGSRAVLLMRDLAPAMSERRTRAIAVALASYSAPFRKLDFHSAEVIRNLRWRGTSISRLARDFGVSRPTIRQVLDGSIYGAPAHTPWRRPGGEAATIPEPGVPLALCELYWVAGWLEGEGSFLGPPPSDPRRPRITAHTCDADVAREVGRLLMVTPLLSHSRRERLKGWSPIWRLLRRGRFAVRLMDALYPLMGARRRAQIESALAAAEFGLSGGGGELHPRPRNLPRCFYERSLRV